MEARTAIKQFVSHMDRSLGIRPWLRGEPRGGFDLAGEKVLDWGWICANLPRQRLRALEIGCGNSPVLPTMLALGYDVVGVDLDPSVANQITGFTFIQGDFNGIELTPGFDLIVACSAVEHFGLSGRYGSHEDENGDLKAMRKIAQLLTPSGLLFLTIPVGHDMVLRPWHRIYGRNRMESLLQGFEVVQSRYLIKEPWGPWRDSTREVAIDSPADPVRYALGEMILKKLK
jgi:SAM-dependent methyltransferase